MTQHPRKLLSPPARLAGCLPLLLAIIGCASTQPTPGPRPAAFWPTYPDEPRVQFLVSYQQSADIEPGKSTLDTLIYGKEPQHTLPLKKPYGLRMWNGRIYICDLRSACVTVLDIRKKQTLLMGKSGTTTMQTPSDIAIAPDGSKYVADPGRGMVFVFDPQDRFVGTFGHKDFVPVGVAVYQNELYVCNKQLSNVEVLDRLTGKLLRTFGQQGPEPGQFIMPVGIAVDDQGNVYVTDTISCRLQKFDRQGKLVTSFGTMSARAGGMVRPKHVAVDHEGIIYVVDAAFQNVQLFNQSGQVLTYFGSSGSHPGAMFLPAGICVYDGDLDLFKDYIHPAFKAQHLVLVSNQFGDNKVSVYALGRLQEGKTVADISTSKGLVPAGTGEPPKTGLGAPLPATLPAAADEPAGPAAPPPKGDTAPTTQPLAR